MQSPNNATSELLDVLYDALDKAQVYLDSYDTSRPSRVRAETTGAVTEALAALLAFKAARS